MLEGVGALLALWLGYRWGAARGRADGELDGLDAAVDLMDPNRRGR
jgi:hypothetical protein